MTDQLVDDWILAWTGGSTILDLPEVRGVSEYARTLQPTQGCTVDLAERWHFYPLPAEPELAAALAAASAPTPADPWDVW